ncbi:DinB family protein [Emticicia sp. SJ17W-69]|uniref:DinB family protein n=1 Tax=Emticicia sp. SJ17W-69 TaxID=3421657 RepID=UPI003EBE5CB4
MLTELQKGLSLNTQKIIKFAEGLSQEEALSRPYDAVNNFLWNLGHVTTVRNTIIKVLNPTEKLTTYENERELFGNGSILQAEDAYPDLNFILGLFEKRGEKINELIEKVSEEYLDQESTIKVGPNPRSNEALLWFFYNHETEHLGEMKVIKNIINRLKNA